MGVNCGVAAEDMFAMILLYVLHCHWIRMVTEVTLAITEVFSLDLV
jgi:hypothetical protein